MFFFFIIQLLYKENITPSFDDLHVGKGHHLSQMCSILQIFVPNAN